MNGKTLKYSVSVAVLAAMMQVTPTFASSIDSQVTKTQKQITETQGQINALEIKIQKLDNQIILEMDKSQKISNDIRVQQAQIENTKADVEKDKKDLDVHKKVYSDRLRSIQAQGQSPIVTYAELLISSNNLSEFLTRSSAIMQILQSDSDIMSVLNKKEQTLNNAEQQLNNELDNLKQSQTELASQQKAIEAAKQEVEKEVTNNKNVLQQQQGQLVQQQAQQQSERIAAQKALQLIIQHKALLVQQQKTQKAQVNAQQQTSSANKTSTSTATSSAPSTDVHSVPYSSDKASQVIAYAEQFLGVPYVWGGTTPSGFDCSGFMQYVFRYVGVDLPRVAEEQQNVGIRISPSQVQPGDLVFMGDPAYHVGMYIGNGKWIQAPETGDVVKISPYNPSYFSTASRVLP